MAISMKRNVNLDIRSIRMSLRLVFAPNKIVWAFIAGSMARGKHTQESDIDIFVCLKTAATPRENKQFLDWYNGLHAKYNLRPDLNYPGEVMPLFRLKVCLADALKTQLQFPPRYQLSSKNAYDGKTWAGMITDPKILLIFNSTYKQEINHLIERADLVIGHWCRGLGVDEHLRNRNNLIIERYFFE